MPHTPGTRRHNKSPVSRSYSVRSGSGSWSHASVTLDVARWDSIPQAEWFKQWLDGLVSKVRAMEVHYPPHLPRIVHQNYFWKNDVDCRYRLPVMLHSGWNLHYLLFASLCFTSQDDICQPLTGWNNKILQLRLIKQSIQFMGRRGARSCPSTVRKECQKKTIQIAMEFPEQRKAPPLLPFRASGM